MHFCERCREQAKAFIKKANVRNVVAKAARMAVAACVLCGAIIGSAASAASAEAGAPGQAEHAAYSAMWEFTPTNLEFLAAQIPSPADRSDSEPPHPAEAEQTFPGSAAMYSGTAPAAGAINGLPQVSTLPYSGGAVPTYTMGGAAARNWVPITVGQNHAPGLTLPEHARLEQLPPVIRMPTEYQGASASPRDDRRDRGYRRGRLPDYLSPARTISGLEQARRGRHWRHAGRRGHVHRV